jgi:glycosyltransferase involved in cell wall biosynthesis
VVDPWSLRLTMEAELARGLRAVHRSRKARQALQLEQGIPRRARLLTVGRSDAERWSSQIDRPVAAIGNGVDASPIRRVPAPEPTVCFVGSLNYEPNIDSAQRLVWDIAPRVWADVPRARFVIAGRSPVPAVLSLASDRVEVLANVPSIQDVFSSAHVAVFPDRHGLGVRNSVREALACGVPVVASRTAARETEHGSLRTGRDTREMAELVVTALREPATSDGVAQTPPMGRTWSAVAREYHEQCRKAIAGR